MLKCKWTSFDKVSWKSQDATHSWPWTHYPHSHNGIPRICHCFLSKTKTPEEQKVTVPLTSFCEPSVANWAKMNKECFCAANFMFMMFMNELWKCFLPPFWENQLFWNIITHECYLPNLLLILWIASLQETICLKAQNSDLALINCAKP